MPWLRPVTTEAWVQSRNSPLEVYDGQFYTTTGFSRSTSVFPVSTVSLMLQYKSSCARRTSGRSLGTFRKSCLSEIAKRWPENFSLASLKGLKIKDKCVGV